MRETIIRCGGEVRFETRVTDLVSDGDVVKGVVTADGSRIDGPVILATGHSARDVYRMLHSRGVLMEPKGLAIGVRLEHPQKLIDCLRYHSKEGRGKYLPAAEYTMLTRVDDRAVYSFCMCPGGFIIPAASEPDSWWSTACRPQTAAPAGPIQAWLSRFCPRMSPRQRRAARP